MFNGSIAINVDKATARKTIVICGCARGGTSFVASTFARLGIPFSRRGVQEISRRTYEHKGLREAFQARNFDAVRAIAAEMGLQHETWGWKLPAIRSELERVGNCTPNPHFVFVFKEALSVAARKSLLHGGDLLPKLGHVLSVYRSLANLAQETKRPLLLVSYDRAMSHLEGFIPEAAAFGGVSRFDVREVISGIRQDQEVYSRRGSRTQATRGAAVALPGSDILTAA